MNECKFVNRSYLADGMHKEKKNVQTVISYFLHVLKHQK